MKFLVLISVLALAGCARNDDPKPAVSPYSKLVGTWSDYHAEQTRAAVNSCREQLTLTADHTFNKTSNCRDAAGVASDTQSQGYYEVIGSDKIQFNYLYGSPELFTYFAQGMELRLVKNTSVVTYYKTN